uniref:TolC family protein n=1 Tax=Phenylobacterium glaciei TaxID=2803784 RepID=A0A974P7H6_9CAUL|nr:TolC family protein [Phenylobacterium glaciei]
MSAAEADILTGRENLRRVETQVLGTVITAYVDTRRDQEALRIRQENVRVLERQLEESKARFDVGEITRTDVAQSESRLAAAVSLFQSSEAQLAISRANYVAAVGQSPGDLAPEPSLAALLPASVDQAFDTAQVDNAQIRAAQYTEQASKARVAGARAERMPTIGLTARLGYTGGASPRHRSLFPQRHRRSDLHPAAVQRRPDQLAGAPDHRAQQCRPHRGRDRPARGAAEPDPGLSQLTAARANIGSTNTQVRAARIAAEGTRQEQQVGLRTTLDVLNAEQELRSAELAQVSARHDEYVAAASVLAQMGHLQASYLTPNVAHYDPKANFGKLRITWGWVPWEEPIAIVDRCSRPPVEKPPPGRPLPANRRRRCPTEARPFACDANPPLRSLVEIAGSVRRA